MEVWPKLTVVRCAVDLAAMPGSIPRRENTTFRIVTVGRLAPEKAHLGLIETLDRMVKRGVDVRLTIVGDGPLRSSIETAVAQRGLIDRVRLRGALPESETLKEIACCDAFILPSLMEGLPVVLIEAMALGKPVVAPYIAGIPELVDDGVTGLLFRPGDWTHLAEQALQLAASSSEAGKMGERGRTRVQREFDVNIAVEPLLELFRPTIGVELTCADSS
jgi:glycosyltransferase involved in cell wall biosynthesis